MGRTLLAAFALSLISMPASAEMDLTMRISMESGATITVSNVSEEDLESGKLEDVLSEATKQARQAWSISDTASVAVNLRQAQETGNSVQRCLSSV